MKFKYIGLQKGREQLPKGKPVSSHIFSIYFAETFIMPGKKEPRVMPVHAKFLEGTSPEDFATGLENLAALIRQSVKSEPKLKVVVNGTKLRTH
ncbi:MAG TPA: hypothetical protein ENG78_05290 [Acidiferrobacteraceae bacterium]|nr:hypothetical protein [Acidiferrobacteraceae bacterium]HEX20215.1 hypothetical protein [Acidiferrobacteraceae bacterium]